MYKGDEFKDLMKERLFFYLRLPIQMTGSQAGSEPLHAMGKCVDLVQNKYCFPECKFYDYFILYFDLHSLQFVMNLKTSHMY